MNWKIMPLAAAALFAASAALAEDPAVSVPVIPVHEIQAGAKGYGLTVIEGDEVRRFDVEVLGVIHNMSPGRDAIIFRAEGLGLEHSGVFGGMSGSPVYIDGRLAGAVAFGWAWQKDAVAGMTPIDDMVRGARTRAAAPPGAPALTAERLLSVVEGRPEGLPEAWRVPAGPGGPVTLATSGFSRSAAALVREVFHEDGFIIADMAPAGQRVGAAAVDEIDEAAADDLQPGSSVYAVLVSGDAFMGAVGTVTDRRGEEIYGFGHQFLNLDAVAIPMYTADVITVFASAMRSFKIAIPKRPVGAITRDFATGVYGRIGAAAETFPVTVTVNSGSETERFRYDLFRHFAISPQLVAAVAAESAESLAQAPRETTLSYRMEAAFAGGRSLTVERVRAGANAPAGMASDLAGLMSTTMHNPLENLLPEQIDISLSLEDTDRTARIESVKIRENEVRPGEVLTLDVRVRPLRGPAETFTLEVSVPRGTAPGTVALVVCDGHTSSSLDLLEMRTRLDPQTIDELLDVLHPRRGAEELVVRLSGAGYGISRAQREFPNLPSSTLAILAAPGDTSAAPIFKSILTAIDTPYVLTGRRMASVLIKAPSEEN